MTLPTPPTPPENGPALTIPDLLDDGRFEEAEAYLGLLAREHPDEAPVHAMHALCLHALELNEDAIAAADRAVALDPRMAYAHWVRGVILLGAGRVNPAAEAANRAVALDPEEPEHLAFLAQTRAALGRWDEALNASERALRLEPGHVLAGNLRALGLRVTRGQAAADQAWRELVAKAPSDPMARAGHAWSLLHRGETAAASEQFEQALLLDPTSEWAREGFLTATKAGNPIYAMMLRYFRWMGARSGRVRMIIALGGLLAYNLLDQVARRTPALKIPIYALLAAFITFIVFSWAADPLFDLLLLLHPDKRRMLSRGRRVAAAAVGLTVLVALISGVWYFASGSDRAADAGLLAAVLTIPMAVVFHLPPGRPRRVMATATAALAAMATITVVLPSGADSSWFLATVVGTVVVTWLGRRSAA